MTIEWEQLVANLENQGDRLDLLTQRVVLLEAHSSDMLEALTEARETINSLGNLVETSHRALIARIDQLERVSRRQTNQIKTIPGVVTRLVDGEKKHRALSLKVGDVDRKVEDEIRERKQPKQPARL